MTIHRYHCPSPNSHLICCTVTTGSTCLRNPVAWHPHPKQNNVSPSPEVCVSIGTLVCEMCAASIPAIARLRFSGVCPEQLGRLGTRLWNVQLLWYLLARAWVRPDQSIFAQTDSKPRPVCNRYGAVGTGLCFIVPRPRANSAYHTICVISFIWLVASTSCYRYIVTLQLAIASKPWLVLTNLPVITRMGDTMSYAPCQAVHFLVKQ